MAEDRCRAFSSDGDHKRVTIDDRWHDEGRNVWIVHRVDWNAKRLGIICNPVVQSAVSRIDQRRTIQQAGVIVPGNPVDSRLGCEFLVEFRRDDGNARLGLEQQADLAESFLAAADHNHRAILEINENRKIAHHCTSAVGHQLDGEAIELGREDDLAGQA